MIIDPASVQDGVRTMHRLSFAQNLLIALVWVAFFAVIVVAANIDPSGGEAFAPVILGMMVFAFVVMLLIARRPRGREYRMIVSAAGIRGDFRIRRLYPLMATWICLLFTSVCVMGMLSEPPNSRATIGWAATGIAFMIGYAIVLLSVRRAIIGLRVDENGHVWLRRRGESWEPLHINEYRHAYGRIVTGRMGSTASRIDFLQPSGDARPIKFPLLMVRSELYGTPTSGVFISGFFQDYVRKSGWRVESKRDGAWKATNPNVL